MARIRSIHPSLFTHSRYMRLSDLAARVLPGIWCEADDAGLFDWEPETLRVRLLPLHPDVDMDAVLAELEAADWIKSFKHDGSDLGACHNFRRYQSPVNPSYRVIDKEDFLKLPPELLRYVNGRKKRKRKKVKGIEGNFDKSSEPYGNSSDPYETERDRDSSSKEEGVPPVALRGEYRLFTEGLAYLGACYPDKSESYCRKMIGGWRKKLHNDDPPLIAILQRAQREDIADPASWVPDKIDRHLGGDKKPRKNGGALEYGSPEAEAALSKMGVRVPWKASAGKEAA